MKIDKIIFAVSASFLLAISTYGQRTSVSLDMHDRTVKEVIQEIEKTSGYIFFYNNKIIDSGKRITITVKDAAIEQILDLIFGKSIHYRIAGRQIVLYANDQWQPDSTQQRDIVVTGVVKDEYGSPLMGVNVVEKGYANGTITDTNGAYSIKTNRNSMTLVYSFVGYVTHEVSVRKLEGLNITLHESSQELEEIVVVGYGFQKKASVVGAITQIQAADLQKSSTPNLTNALAGRIAGVITIMGSGKPGNDDSEIYIRGQATTNSTAPLVLVDGIERDWKQTDPEDIETFSVLKDASATAVYGVRGANGVILITTKRGQAGKPVLSISTQSAIQQPIRIPDYLGSYDYATLMNEALRNDGKPEEYTASDLEHYRLGDSPYTHPDNDYYRDFLKRGAFQQMANLNARGGTEYLLYYISAGILHQEGLYKEFENSKYPTNINYDRFNFRSNLDFNITKNLSLGVDLTGRMEIRKQPNFTEDVFDKIRRLPPNWQSYINPDGTIGGRSDETRLSPYALISQYGNRKRNKNVLEGLFRMNEKADYITPGLSFRVQLGITSSFESRRDIKAKPELWEYDRHGRYTQNRVREDISIDTGKGPGARQISFEGGVDYVRTFRNHSVTGMLLYHQSRYWYENDTPTGYFGAVGRATYAYRQRYLLEVNAGYNGSMQFAQGRRLGFFPAFSAGWVISEETFWKEDITAVSYLKFRGSYGEIGNDKIGDFKYIYNQRYNYMGTDANWQYYWGESMGSYAAQQAILEGQPGNLAVTWERASKANIGFDARFLDNMLSLTLDFFMEKRKNILAIPYSIPLTFGMNNPQDTERGDKQGLPPANIGRVTNKGLDFEIGFNSRLGKFSYYAKANFVFTRNRIDRIDEEGKKYEWQKTEGKRIGQHFGLTDTGLYQIGDFEQNPDGSLLLAGGFPVLRPGIPLPAFGVVYPGDCRYADLNGDEMINSYDMGAIGKGNIPEYNWGVTLGGDYAGFDFSLLFQGAGNAHVYFNEDAVWEFYWMGKVMRQHLERYNPEDPATWGKATYPRLHSSDNLNNHQKTTRWLFPRNYFRLKNAEIGYSMSGSLLSKIKISRVRIFINGTNLFSVDRVMNWDPEAKAGNGNQYVQLRNWNAGVNITF